MYSRRSVLQDRIVASEWRTTDAMVVPPIDQNIGEREIWHCDCGARHVREIVGDLWYPWTWGKEDSSSIHISGSACGSMRLRGWLDLAGELGNVADEKLGYFFFIDFVNCLILKDSFHAWCCPCHCRNWAVFLANQ